MSINVLMPALSPTMTDGTLSRWLVSEGDRVSSGDVIAEIETDKATMEVESIDDGVVLKIVVVAGTSGVSVNSVIAVLGEEGESIEDLSVDRPVQSAPKNAVSESPNIVSLQTLNTNEGEMHTPQSSVRITDRIFASPLARRLAESRGIDLSTLSGSGPRGRIVKSDVEGSSSSVSSVPDSDSYEKKPHDGMRRVIAERLTSSLREIPSYNVSVECRLDALLDLRSTINASAPRGENDEPMYRISVNDIVVKALAMALRDVPSANVTWTATDRVYHKGCDIGVAVAVDDGLFTPIVRSADSKTLSVISNEIKDLALRARSKKLLPEEYQGGCTSVSNLGMYGVDRFTSIINPPHASIVSIGAGKKRAIVDDNDNIISATILDATFAFDHRAIDGALGGELASSFRHYVEFPTSMLV